MSLSTGAALLPAERRAVALLAAIYATRLLGLFLLLPVLALHAGSLPGGTPLLAGLAVGAYGLTQALMQIPFGTWSDRVGRKPMIVVGLILHVAGSALGAVAAHASTLVAARMVQGLGAVSGPVTALLADLTRSASRTRAMFAIGLCIGASFVVSLVAGPWLAGAIGVPGVFALIGVSGIFALGLVQFALPAGPAKRAAAGTGHSWRRVLTRRLAPHFAGVFVLHLTLTATFIAVPHALRDLHGISIERHWLVYLVVFAASIALTLPCVIWSERRAFRSRTVLVSGASLAAALAALVVLHAELSFFCAALVVYFGAFNFLEARLPASLSERAAQDARGAALGVFATCQFAGAFAGGALGGWLMSRVPLPWIFGACTIAVMAWLPLARTSENARMENREIPVP